MSALAEILICLLSLLNSFLLFLVGRQYAYCLRPANSIVKQSDYNLCFARIVELEEADGKEAREMSFSVQFDLRISA